VCGVQCRVGVLWCGGPGTAWGSQNRFTGSCKRLYNCKVILFFASKLFDAGSCKMFPGKTEISGFFCR